MNYDIEIRVTNAFNNTVILTETIDHENWNISLTAVITNIPEVVGFGQLVKHFADIKTLNCQDNAPPYSIDWILNDFTLRKCYD